MNPEIPICSILSDLSDSLNKLVIGRTKIHSDHYIEYGEESLTLCCVQELPDLSRFTRLKRLYCVDVQMKKFLVDSIHEPVEDLNCSENQIQCLPGLPRTLKRLDCAINCITRLPELPEGLVSLKASFNRITEIRRFPNDLVNLEINCNQLADLPDVTNEHMKLFWCSDNLLVKLPKLNLTIEDLRISKNRITHLPRLKHTYLRTLVCECNQLTELPELPDTLVTLQVSKNQLKCLPDLKQVKFVSCSYNEIEVLPEINSALYGLIVDHNRITRLPPLIHTNVLKINCAFNQIEELPELNFCLKELLFQNNVVHKCPKLHKQISILNCSDNLLRDPPKLLCGIQHLYMDNNPLLTRLPVFVNTLQTITCINCPMITHIPSMNHTTFLQLYKFSADRSGVRTCNYVAPKYSNFQFQLENTPLTQIIENNDLIRMNNVLYRFRRAFYYAKYRVCFRRWLWERVRMPKIAEQYSPHNLMLRLNMIQNEDDDATFDELLKTW